MRLHELKAVPGATRAPKRKGRGTATGQGKTAGRGNNGESSIYNRRIPKRGFTNIWRKEYEIVNVETLNRFDNGTEVTPELLIAEGIVKQVKDGIKILGNGKLEKNLTVQAQKFTKSALEKIEAAGGKAQVI